MNIVIAQLLDSTSAALARQLSQSCEPYATKPPLILQEHSQVNPAIPHIAHFHLEIDPCQIDLLHTALWHLSIETQNTRIGGYFREIVLRNKKLMWVTDASQELKNLHRRVVEVSAPFHRNKQEVNWPIASNQKAMLDMYGYPDCMECFVPHVTLSELSEPPPFRSDIVSAYSRTIFNWHSKILVIGLLGPRGTMTKIIGRLPLLPELDL